MPQAQPQFDGQNPVAGYTLIQRKDGSSLYLKGENLSSDDVAQRLTALGNQTQPAPPLPPDHALSRTLGNMTAAMSGQPMQNADDQSQFEQGRKAGTIAGGLAIAGGALGGAIPAATAPTIAGTETVGTGILGPEGQELTRMVTKYGPSLARTILTHPLAKTALKWAVGGAASTLAGTAGYKTLKALGVLD